MRSLPSSALGLLLLASTCAFAREYGPPVGSKMTAFELPDQSGKVHSLKSLLGTKGAVIVLYRSADW